MHVRCNVLYRVNMLRHRSQQSQCNLVTTDSGNPTDSLGLADGLPGQFNSPSVTHTSDQRAQHVTQLRLLAQQWHSEGTTEACISQLNKRRMGLNEPLGKHARAD